MLVRRRKLLASDGAALSHPGDLRGRPLPTTTQSTHCGNFWGAWSCPCLQGARGEAIERKYSPTRVSIRENDVSGAATQETLKL